VRNTLESGIKSTTNTSFQAGMTG